MNDKTSFSGNYCKSEKFHFANISIEHMDLVLSFWLFNCYLKGVFSLKVTMISIAKYHLIHHKFLCLHTELSSETQEFPYYL